MSTRTDSLPARSACLVGADLRGREPGLADGGEADAVVLAARRLRPPSPSRPRSARGLQRQISSFARSRKRPVGWPSRVALERAGVERPGRVGRVAVDARRARSAARVADELVPDALEHDRMLRRDADRGRAASDAGARPAGSRPSRARAPTCPAAAFAQRAADALDDLADRAAVEQLHLVEHAPGHLQVVVRVDEPGDHRAAGQVLARRRRAPGSRRRSRPRRCGRRRSAIASHDRAGPDRACGRCRRSGVGACRRCYFAV